MNITVEDYYKWSEMRDPIREITRRLRTIKCRCGSIIKRENFSQHSKTKKHQEFIKKIE